MSARPENYSTHRLDLLEDPDHGIRVPITQVLQDDAPDGTRTPPFPVYRTAGPGCDPEVGLPSLRGGWIIERGDVEQYVGRDPRPRR